ncbi:MAG: galactokinase family protein [Oscillospiraceae bacterium]|nr:galactokinase family protein [Oscillospiraceae bacterium]
MVKTSLLKEKLRGSEYDAALERNYKKEDIEAQKSRYIRIASSFEELFGSDREVGVFSAPGRTEVCGNHTDHNHGKVLAASVNLDAVAVAGINGENIVRVKSEGYKMDVVDLNDLGVMPAERGKSAALVRGVCAGFKNRGYEIGGFDAATASDVLSGSGLSSSAAFEVLLGTMLNHLYNGGKISSVEIAQIAQFAENEYFGKPCGLMDQMACSVGGFVEIDFKDPAAPVIEKLDFDFGSCKHALCIVDTGGDHSDLTDEYAAVRSEMEDVASKFGKSVLREVDREEFEKNIAVVRDSAGDRAVLRAMHFYNENVRVEKQAEALKKGDFEAFKALVIESGFSSYMYNQNVFTCKAPSNQPVSLALSICQQVLSGKGAWRVHGGGFAGTIQAFVPEELLGEFKSKICAVFGEKSCYVLNIRPEGGIQVI